MIIKISYQTCADAKNLANPNSINNLFSLCNDTLTGQLKLITCTTNNNKTTMQQTTTTNSEQQCSSILASRCTHPCLQESTSILQNLPATLHGNSSNISHFKNDTHCIFQPLMTNIITVTEQATVLLSPLQHLFTHQQ